MDQDTLISELDHLRQHFLVHFQGTDQPYTPRPLHEGATITTYKGLIIEHDQGEFVLWYGLEFDPSGIKMHGSVAKLEDWMDAIGAPLFSVEVSEYLATIAA